MRAPNTIIFDVRTPKEVAEGQIEGTHVTADFNNTEEFKKPWQLWIKRKTT